MSVSMPLLQLLDYSDHERAKWQEWVVADVSRLALPFQADGRFPTVGHLLDHIHLVERRHLARMQGSVPPDTSGVMPSDAAGLFEYGRLVRADFRRYLEDLDEETAASTVAATVASGGTYALTRRKLAMHVILHETRHLAQIACAARAAGHAPPGEHDLFYFTELA